MRPSAILFAIVFSLFPAGCGCGGGSGETLALVRAAPPAWCRAAWLIERTSSNSLSTISSLDLVTGAKTLIPHSYTGRMNALGYSQIDDRMYGIDRDVGDPASLAVLRISFDTTPLTIERLDVPLPAALVGVVSTRPAAGDVSADGFLYLPSNTGRIEPGAGLLRVNVNPLSPQYLVSVEFIPYDITGVTLGSGDSFGDLVISPADGRIYILGFGGGGANRLWRVDPQSGVVEDLGTPGGPTGRYGGAYFSGTSSFWLHNATGGIWEIDLVDPTPGVPTAVLGATTTPSTGNDGAFCLGGS